MIVNYDDLVKYQRKCVMVDGCFDPLHIGHLKYFDVASTLGFPLFCNVQSDDYISNNKKRPNLLPELQRINLIDSLKTISYVHLCKTSTSDVLSKLQPLKYVKGMDWKKKGLPNDEQEVCKKYGIEILFLDTNVDSSTNIVRDFIRNKDCNSLKEFEGILFSQKEIEPHYYDEHYFRGDWRNGQNDYSLETRRIIEAKNPVNIKEVFRPKRVLDVGCGPGALMYFLYELGIETYGIDFSQAAKDLAPKEVRSNIVVAPVTEYYNFGIDFDLVICRELLEHLTILQIRQAVKVLADYTSKYLYVTTRFHPSPVSLLDVTDDRVTDPTHITLLNKDFLKLLFMLEGLRPRPDLEEKMDWKKLGRVLVFERVYKNV
ncbi:methyltransferase domain-containing protein [Thermosulfuriphilus ammonigenes]|uniref:methyltransferase domain-containing protein n=2 Tax=Thermosulfuriphilus ammonigenes TaxID=1936021 RepID=UPI001AEFCC89|nr:methyltransferase domain-containing protein [Thermosulfuriphilus ammonigenes]